MLVTVVKLLVIDKVICVKRCTVLESLEYVFTRFSSPPCTIFMTDIASERNVTLFARAICALNVVFSPSFDLITSASMASCINWNISVTMVTMQSTLAVRFSRWKRRVAPAKAPGWKTLTRSVVVDNFSCSLMAPTTLIFSINRVALRDNISFILHEKKIRGMKK